MPEDEKCRTDNITPWDKAFMDVELMQLLSLIQAADYMEITGLCSLGCKTISNMIKDRSPQEVREAFGIDLNDDQ